MTNGQSQLILLEGLPGSGKSTNSRRIMSNIDQLGRRVKWVHEVARPHPTLFFNEANLTFEEYYTLINRFPDIQPILDSIKKVMYQTISLDLLELEWHYIGENNEEVLKALKEYDVWNFTLHKYMEVALEKWMFFVQDVKREEDLVVILDSSIFQYQIYSFLGKNAPYEMLEDFIQKLFHTISDLHPALIYFYRDNVENAISYLEEVRGVEFFESIWERDHHQAYYQSRPRGAEGYREFLRDYDKIAHMLFSITPFRKIGIEISNGKWNKYVYDILFFLGLDETNKDLYISYPTGEYENKRLNLKLEVQENYFIDPSGKKKRLYPRRENEFYVEDLPIMLRFEYPNKMIVEGEQLIDRWTTFGTEFNKVIKP